MDNSPYEEETIKTVDELIIELAKRLGKPGYVFRGVRRSSWDITSSLGRSPSLSQVLGMKTAQSQAPHRESESLSTFIEAARRLGSTRPETDLAGWLIEMQHYGAPTRLLDWTTMPAVAAYFAYEEPDDDDPQRCIWALNWNSLQEYHQIPRLVELAQTPEDYFGSGSPRTPESETARLRKAIEDGSGVPLPIRPLDPDSRMLAQYGLLTATTNKSLSLDKDTLHSAVTKKFPVFESKSTLVKINLPAGRKSALSYLRHLGFSRHRLFPDLQGIGTDLTERMNNGGGDHSPLSFS